MERHLHLLAQTGSGPYSVHFLKQQCKTQLSWISGAPQDSKASFFLCVGGLILQLRPEGSLTAQWPVGHQRQTEVSGVSLLSSCCAARQVQNGLALYMTWTSIATLLNFAVVLIYKWNVSNEKATTASLSILALSLVVW